MARKRYKYVFTRKKHTKGGKLSSILAFASFLLFVGSAICSMMMGGIRSRSSRIHCNRIFCIWIYSWLKEFFRGKQECIVQQSRRSGKRAVNSTLDYDVFDWNWMR